MWFTSSAKKSCCFSCSLAIKSMEQGLLGDFVSRKMRPRDMWELDSIWCGKKLKKRHIPHSTHKPLQQPLFLKQKICTKYPSLNDLPNKVFGCFLINPEVYLPTLTHNTHATCLPIFINSPPTTLKYVWVYLLHMLFERKHFPKLKFLKRAVSDILILHPSDHDRR